LSSTDHDRHRRLVHEVIALRQGELGLWQVEPPDAGRDLSEDRRQAMEAMLALPAGTLAAIRDINGPYRELEAEEIAARLGVEAPLVEETVPTCGACVEPVALLLVRRELPIRVAAASDRRCLCRQESCDALDYLFRIAIEVAGRPRLLVLGGNPDSDRALRRIKDPEVQIVRERPNVDKRLVGTIDVLLIAQGMTKHKHTLPYTTAYDALPEAQRPLRITTPSPNANAVAETLLRERERIRASLGKRTRER
jgi:hypothetical protein